MNIRKELEELKAGFSAMTLPESLQLDKATYIPDLKDTLERLFLQADIYCENPKMQGSVLLLRRIRAVLSATLE